MVLLISWLCIFIVPQILIQFCVIWKFAGLRSALKIAIMHPQIILSSAFSYFSFGPTDAAHDDGNAAAADHCESSHQLPVLIHEQKYFSVSGKLSILNFTLTQIPVIGFGMYIVAGMIDPGIGLLGGTVTVALFAVASTDIISIFLYICTLNYI